MSTLSQFFGPRPTIQAHVLLAAGGGGGGGLTAPGSGPGATFYSGGGGGGGIFYGYIDLEPGKTYPVVIGAGSPAKGGTSTFDKFSVSGGGQGGGTPATPAPATGNPGGCGGGSGGLYFSTPPLASAVPGGRSLYGNAESRSFNANYYGSPGSDGPAYESPNSVVNVYRGGGAGGYEQNRNAGFLSTIEGIDVFYCTGGRTAPVPAPVNSGNGGAYNTANPGQPGIFIIQYPTSFSVAPAFPGATDISPSTPGYRTYRFSSSGSITLP